LLLEAVGWLIFLVALLFSVMLHETGHFVAAKRFGMKCTQYFLGFGPTVWSFYRGETEYGIKALPLGGFVKITGMTSIDEVDEEDEPRSFRRAPGWQRLIVLGAGSFMHFVLAAVLIFALALGIGVANYNTTQAGTVDTCVGTTAKAETALLNGAACGPADQKSPAALAGVQVGDTVTSFNGVKVSTFTGLKSQVEKLKAGTVVPFTVERDGRPLHLTAKLVHVPGSGTILCVDAGVVFQRQGVVSSVGYVGSGFSQVFTGSVSALGELPAALPNLFKKDRSTTAAGNVSSVVGAARDTGDAVAADAGWQQKVSFILLLIASLNIFVGVFNLLPLLPMDGGHIAVVLWEMVRRRFARLTGRPDPGLVDYRKLIPVSAAVFVVLVLFGSVLILADIVNPVNIG
jgi:membrane-associated protease RseP (regulator of RpoE activity)